MSKYTSLFVEPRMRPGFKETRAFTCINVSYKISLN